LKRNSFRSGIDFFGALSSHDLPMWRKRLLVTSFFVPIFFISGIFSPIGQGVFAESGSPPKETQIQADVQRLEGQWVRPDGGYILELRDIKKDGSLIAAYFNPRPIKVFSAKWSREDGKINLFVELRDFNYPGSKYNLQYEPRADRLKGTYFQAVERQTFSIEFVRVESKKEGK